MIIIKKMPLGFQLLCTRASVLPRSLAINSRSLSVSGVGKASGTSGSGSGSPADPKTHTGQTFEPDDYRLVRFMDKEKQVNTRFAIDLIAQVPPTQEKSSVVSCDGGGGPLGHPKVYINLDQPGNHSCGYCGLRFYKDGKGGHGHGH